MCVVPSPRMQRTVARALSRALGLSAVTALVALSLPALASAHQTISIDALPDGGGQLTITGDTRGDLITVTVVGDAFLRGMVRRIVAALLRVGTGKASAKDLADALRANRPAFNGEAAAPRGLTLWRVPMGRPRTRKREEQDNSE